MEFNKRCLKCLQVKPLDSFAPTQKGSAALRDICMDCEAEGKDNSANREAVRRYRAENREELVDRAKEARRALKHEVIQAYGGKCVCCGESEELLLNIDHIHNDGKAHRESLDKWHGNTARQTYKWLKEHDFPKGNFQVLCFNCNIAKQRYGICPHEVHRRKSGIPANPDLEGPPNLVKDFDFE